VWLVKILLDVVMLMRLAVVTRSCAIRSGGEVLFVNDDERT